MECEVSLFYLSPQHNFYWIASSNLNFFPKEENFGMSQIRTSQSDQVLLEDIRIAENPPAYV